MVLRMHINVNGEGREVPPGTTVAALLELLAAPRQATAVEVNRRLVPRAEHAAHALAEGDAVEIVTLVGGG
jgi:thiamine biosynthesis protein ThiS